MRLLLALLLVHTVFGDSALLGNPLCAKGPEIWCKSLSTAKLCQATKHCIQTVWEKQQAIEDNSEICDECKEMVAQARAQLLTNETQEEIKEVLEGTCRIYFPIKFIAKECIKIVDEYLPDYIDMLASRMDPLQVCTVARLCNNAKLVAKAEKYKEDLFNDVTIDKIVSYSTISRWKADAMATDTCTDCTKFATEFKDKLSGMSRDELEQYLNNVCEEAGGNVKDGCKMLVSTYIQQIYVFIQSVNPSEICKFVGMCSELLVGQTAPWRNKNDQECEFCEALVQNVRSMIIANSTEEEVKEALLNLCNNLGSLKDICTQNINQYFDVIYHYLTDELDPQLVCTALGLCKQVPMVNLLPAYNMAELNEIPISKVQITPLEPAKDRSDGLIRVSLSKDTSSIRKQMCVGNQETCILCEYALHELQNELQDNKTEENIKKKVEGLCTHLPQTIVQSCENFVEIYGDQLIALLSQDIDPATVCVKIRLCDKPKAVDLRFPKCESCELILDYLIKALSIDRIQKLIVNDLDKICEVVPSRDREYCTSMIDTYGPYLIQLITELSNDGGKVCQALDLCPQPQGAAHILGGHKCTYGPSYWCSTKFHAKACKAVSHCDKVGWKISRN